jgi:hypothetical protein
VDAKILGLEREALPWLLVGVLLGVFLAVSGQRAVYALWPDLHRTALVPLGLLLLGLGPCYCLGRWRPEGRDPAGLLTITLKDATRPGVHVYDPDAWVAPGGYPDRADRAPRGDGDEEEARGWTP